MKILLAYINLDVLTRQKKKKDTREEYCAICLCLIIYSFSVSKFITNTSQS